MQQILTGKHTFPIEVKLMHKKILLMVALFIAVGVSVVSAEEINPVLGKVGDFVIRETDLDRLIAGQPLQVQKQYREKPELKTSLVREILLKKAIALKARKEGFDKKPEYREQLSLVIDEFLANEYLSKVVIADIKVPEEEMKKYYKEHEKDFLVPEKVKARHIFIQVKEGATAEEKTKARAKADGILDRLKKGEDFAKVAAEVSEDADSAKNGGDLGVLSPGKTNSTAFENAAFALKNGEISPVVETPFGLHIIKADERTAQRTATFDETRGYIEAVLKKEYEQKKGEEFIAQVMKENGLALPEEQAAGSNDPAAKKPEK
jgi:peptidyl-prolyl cis-trans isomerase C